MKLYLVNQMELASNWGYFEISQYYSQDMSTSSAFPELFATFKQSPLFLHSKAYTATNGRDVPDDSASSFGRCLWERVSIDAYRQISYDQFFSLLTTNAEELKEYGLKPCCDESTFYALDNEILPFAKKMLPPDAAYHVFEPNEKDIGGVGVRIWNYFKNFIVYSNRNQQVFRVDIGVD